MDDPDGHILPLASDYRKVVAGLIQKNTRYAHMLPQAHTLFQLFGGKRYLFSLRRWDFTQANVAVKTRSWAAIPDGCDYPEAPPGLLSGDVRTLCPGTQCHRPISPRRRR